ncbi:hypothetical protein M885DRAFT_610959 [Pelagophyceae sp. CCMP2097]|nr:hypothetical protein M885DRAFT_610959 [Pelagophyceae sp. CCMP2097]
MEALRITDEDDQSSDVTTLVDEDASPIGRPWSAAAILADYKSGGDRYGLCFRLRELRDDGDLPDGLVTALFSDRATGERIMLRTLVGDDVDVEKVASKLSSVGVGSCLATMLLYDEEAVLFLARGTEGDIAKTLVLTCGRDVIEAAVLARAHPRGARSLPVLLPTFATLTTGGTGFGCERTASYMENFEPDEHGRIHGKRCVAWSGLRDYEGPFLDVMEKSARADGSVFERPMTGLGDDGKDEVFFVPLDTLDKQWTDAEEYAREQYVEALLTMYQTIDVAALPPPGSLRRPNYPHVVLRALVDLERASPQEHADPAVTRQQNAARLYAFVYSGAPARVFARVVGFL